MMMTEDVLKVSVKKNDIVCLNEQFQLPWGDHQTLEKGTELLVWHVMRNGILKCSVKGSTGGMFAVSKNKVSPIYRNRPMPKIGDLFVASWGYDQQNLDWYQVVEVKSKSVVVRKIGAGRKYDGPMSGMETPTPNLFISGPETHVVKFTNTDQPYFRVASYAHAYLTDGGSKFFSEWH